MGFSDVAVTGSYRPTLFEGIAAVRDGDTVQIVFATIALLIGLGYAYGAFVQRHSTTRSATRYGAVNDRADAIRGNGRLSALERAPVGASALLITAVKSIHDVPDDTVTANAARCAELACTPLPRRLGRPSRQPL